MRLEALQPQTLAAWEKCGFLKECYLAGGTALALQLGHRQSIDLDFFFDQPIKRTMLSAVEEHFGASATVIIQKSTELTVFIQGVKLTLLHYPFDLLQPTIATGVIPLASVCDIAAMKAYAMGRRQSLKDYVDVYAVLSRQYTTLSTIIADAQQKFADAFSDRAFLRQLLAPDDLEQEEILWLGQAISQDTMKRFFEECIKNQIKLV